LIAKEEFRMKPQHIVACNNKDCAECGKELAATKEAPNEYNFGMPTCPKCKEECETVRIEHDGNVFRSVAAFQAYVTALLKEWPLLDRLVKAGAATDQEKEKVNRMEEVLKDVKCPCCLGDALLSRNNPANKK
jgi:hypothetical protein